MGFETLPGYDAWKTTPPDASDDYEAGLEHFAPDAPEFCEQAHGECPHARWGMEDADGDSAFTGCMKGVTAACFLLIGDGEDCVEVQRQAEDFDAAEYYRGLYADSQDDF